MKGGERRKKKWIKNLKQRGRNDGAEYIFNPWGIRYPNKFKGVKLGDISEFELIDNE